MKWFTESLQFVFVFDYSAYLPPNSALARHASSRKRHTREKGHTRDSQSDVLAKLGELTHSLTQQIASKTEELEKFRGLIEQVQVPVLHFYLLTFTSHFRLRCV